jgi:hypothetical protein
MLEKCRKNVNFFILEPPKCYKNKGNVIKMYKNVQFFARNVAFLGLFKAIP